MGAGVLPATLRKGKLWFLFGKENQFETSAPGFSDFGGGSEGEETAIQTAIREGGEEMTGFLGTNDELDRMLKKHGTYEIDFVEGKYKTFIFPMAYDPYLERYYNNNQKFLQKRLDVSIIKRTKIFEKAEIRWMCVDDIKKMRKEFRSYFQEIVDMICEQHHKIKRFIMKSKKNVSKKQSSKKNITKKNIK
jgi:transcription termination factor NusB